MAFNIYDFDTDHFICEFDLYTLFKTYEFEDEVLIKIYSSDMSLIEKAIGKKRTSLGMSNDDGKFKLKEIDKRLQKLGGRLQLTTLLDDERLGTDADRFEEVEQLSDSDSEEN